MNRVLLLIASALFTFQLPMAAQPFPTPSTAPIQSLLDAAQPGATVEIPGGIYFGRLSFPRDGEPGKPITLRPEEDRIVIINAGRRLEVALSPAPGLPGVFKGKVAPGILSSEAGLWEIASRLRLKHLHDPGQCARRLASWHYSPQSGEIFIRSSGRLPADRMEYWIESDQPAITISRSHVRVERLHATLGKHGIFVDKKTKDVRVRQCRVYCNKSAGIHVTGTDHRIVGNSAFHNNHYGIQLRYHLERSQVADNLCYLNGPANGEATDTSEPTDLGIYSKGAYNLFEGNIACGFTKNAYRNKYAENATNLFRGNVVKGNANPARASVHGNTFLVVAPGPRAGMYLDGEATFPPERWKKADPTGLQRAANLIHPALHREDPRFCDPEYRDFRLQADSPYRGQGAHPGFAPVFYVDPASGREGNDGLSTRRPFASINAALAVIPGDATLYLLPGEYSEPVTFTFGGPEGHPLRVRAWQRSREVVVSAPWTLSGALNADLDYNKTPGANGVELEGLHFRDAALLIRRAEGVRIAQCHFEGPKAGVFLEQSEKIALVHNTFTRSAVAVRSRQGRSLSITQNLFDDSGTTFDLDHLRSIHADFNQYRPFLAKVGSDQRFEAFQTWTEKTGNDRWSFLRKEPDTTAPIWTQPDFAPPGIHTKTEQPVEIDALKVTGIHPAGATVLWESPKGNTFAEVTVESPADGKITRADPVMQFEIMAEFFDLLFPLEGFFNVERHAPLTGLAPDTQYKVSVTPRDLAGRRGAPRTITFRTPVQARKGVTFYLRPDGDDRADGRSRATAWKSFHHAVRNLGPGDQLVLMDGVYHEILAPAVSGSAEAPITIRAENRGKAIIDLAESLPVGVEIANVRHVEIDGLLLRGGAYSVGTYFVISHAEGIRIAHCETDYPAGSSFEKRKAGHHGLLANRAPGLVVEDNLFLCSIIHVGIAASPGAIVRHNSLIGEGNYGIVVAPENAGESYRIEANLFYNVIFPSKLSANLWFFSPTPKIVSDHNLFYLAPDARGSIGELAEPGKMTTLAQWREQTGLDLNSLTAQPLFRDPDRRDFTLTADSPGKGEAANGDDIGKRP
ncbi:MAG TPA: right-handed parallel beta-helix repeat-containing protein [Chthoniobacteraceae bacterium]|nr:right-handed parallel beta-helix repeat-containing protein [Chthoniobacteraceae bacterium]